MAQEVPVVVVQAQPVGQVMAAQVVAAPAQIITAGLPHDTTMYKCQWCGHDGMTRVTYHVCTGTHIAALGICCFTGCFCCLPYIGDCCKSSHHTCSNCNRLIGISTFIAE